MHLAEDRVAHAFLQDSDKPAHKKKWRGEVKHRFVVEQQRVRVGLTP